MPGRHSSKSFIDRHKNKNKRNISSSSKKSASSNTGSSDEQKKISNGNNNTSNSNIPGTMPRRKRTSMINVNVLEESLNSNELREGDW